MHVNMIFSVGAKPTTDHYIYVKMSVMASEITGVLNIYSTVYSGADQRKYQSPASLALVGGIHR